MYIHNLSAMRFSMVRPRHLGRQGAYISIYAHINIHVCIYIYIHIYIYIYTYIHTYIHTYLYPPIITLCPGNLISG